MIYGLGQQEVSIRGKDYFVAENAVVVGAVILEDNVSIWYNAVVRGDLEPITIGEGSNIQDGSILHTSGKFPLTIGKGVTVGHMAVLHGCRVGDNTLVGMGAIILDGARIGKNCIIGAGSLITRQKEIPDNSIVMGSPGRIVDEVTAEQEETLKRSSQSYIENFKRYKRELRPW